MTIGNRDNDGISPNIQRNDKLKALSSVFGRGSLKALEKVQKPYVIKHHFNESSRKAGILVWRWHWLKQNDQISVFNPENEEIKLFRKNEGYSGGRDFENYSKDIINYLASKLIDTNFSAVSFNKGNAGYTWHGKAENAVASFETVVGKSGQETAKKSFVKFSRIWNGWKTSRKKPSKE